MSIYREHFRQALGRTPFIDRIEALSKTEDWTAWNSYKVARVVDNLSTEYFSVRSGCSVMDLTPMEKYRIRGKDAYAYLDRLLTRDLSKLKPGRVTYVVWCNDEGQLIDDGTLFQLRPDDYRLCSQHHQLDWLLLSAQGFDVSIELETHEIAALAVQGPTAFAALSRAGLSALDKLKPFGIVESSLGGIPVLVSRTGYTGDLGYELWVSPENAGELWDRIFAVQPYCDIHVIGLDALEMVRVEAGFVMPGFDFNTAESTVRTSYTRSPYEAGLGWVVHLDKGHFTGRRALQDEQARAATRRLCKIVVDGNKPVGESFLYDAKNGCQVGEIKVAVWSPVLKANIGLADIELQKGVLPGELWANIDYQRELKWHSVWARCRIRKTAFYSPEHRSLTPPGAF
ncbi:MAG: aminomethyltransferase family protein [Pseudomonadota bacterium]